MKNVSDVVARLQKLANDSPAVKPKRRVLDEFTCQSNLATAKDKCRQARMLLNEADELLTDMYKNMSADVFDNDDLRYRIEDAYNAVRAVLRDTKLPR